MVYVVERYLPGLSRSNLLHRLAELQRSAHEAGEGPAVRYLGSTIVIGDEACFCQFEAPSEAAVAAANRRAGLRFDRIVPALTVNPTDSDPRRVSMSVPTTVSNPIQLRHRWRLAAVAGLLAAGTTAAVLAISVGTSTTENASSPSAKVPRVNESQYVQALSSMSPTQIAAAFGTQDVGPRLSPNEQRYVEAFASLTPKQIAAAFGTDGVTSGRLSPTERQYVQAMSEMSPAQIAAAFGTGR